MGHEKGPARGRARRLINRLPAITPEDTVSHSVGQLIARRYRVSRAVGELVAHLAGLGPQEARQ